MVAVVADGHQLGYPTVDDLAYHLATLFPPVRPKGWLELRMIDAVPDPRWQVAVALPPRWSTTRRRSRSPSGDLRAEAGRA